MADSLDLLRSNSYTVNTLQTGCCGNERWEVEVLWHGAVLFRESSPTSELMALPLLLDKVADKLLGNGRGRDVA